jgi:DNA helicase-2/ATP-dependent DNA helicase PcrA
MAAEITWAKVSNVAAADYPAIAERAGREVADHTPDVVSRVMAHYEAVKAARGVIDFDDILLCTAGLLAEHADVAGEVRRQYRHFVVDEYQDVSPLQQALLDLWRGDSEELCVVGDPAQTIHAFAGARSDFLTGFSQRHPGATRIALVRDYRSTPQVVSLANRVMAGQPEAMELRAQRPAGPEPVIAGSDSETGEAVGGRRMAHRQARAGHPVARDGGAVPHPRPVPVFEAALADAGVPFRTRGSEGFFERPEVKAALRALAGVAKAAQDPGGARSARGGRRPGLDTRASRRAGQRAGAVGVVGRPRRSGRRVRDIASGATAAALVAELEGRAARQHAPTGQGVTLSTLHAAKGLEWDAVALVGVHEGGLPFALATTPTQIAEERRLLYVGLTRARDACACPGPPRATGGATARR